MKQPAAIFLLLSLTLLNVKECSMYLLYEINRSYITENYCENIAKPELECEGKCFLLKNLEQQDQKEIPALQDELQKLVFIAPHTSSILKKRNADLLTFFDIAWAGRSAQSDIFHPPAA